MESIESTELPWDSMESVEFFQFHGIRPWNSFSSTESVEIGGIWRHVSMECRGIFTSLQAPQYCHHFSWKPRHLLNNSVRILHGSIPRNSTMIPWHIYRRATVLCKLVWYTLLKLLFACNCCLLITFANSFRARSGPTKCQTWSGSKLYDSLMVIIKELYSKFI